MKFLSYAVMVYMLLALIWWTILLTRNNTLLHQTNIELIKTQNLNSHDGYKNDVTVLIESVNEDYANKKNMILGEGIVFGISLILGLWFIQKAYSQAIENTKVQKNFLLSVTHELKSPIASINLITETLQKRKLSSDQASELYSSILGESKRLESLVTNLLVAARLDNSYSYNFEKCDLLEITNRVIKSLNIESNNDEIEIKSYKPNPMVYGDRESLISVFTNLIENSIKYSPSPAKIKVSIIEKNLYVGINIADRGYGIPDNEKTKATKQFYRIGNEETRKTKGTGLGLYIVSKIIEAHNGVLNIKDNNPRGTIVEVTLPIKQKI